MAITSTEPKRTDAEILADYLVRAGLSQRDGAKALRTTYPAMRKYCSGDRKVPITVLLGAQQLPLADRHMQVVRLLNLGKLPTRDRAITKARLIRDNKKLRNVIDFLVGRTDTLR